MRAPRFSVGLLVLLGGLAAGPAIAAPIQIVFDYRFDTGGFFGTEASPNTARRSALEEAAKTFTHRFSDNLAAIVPEGVNTWSATFFNPATGSWDGVEGLSVPRGTLVVFVGARNLGGSQLAEGGPGGYDASGTNAWLSLLDHRRQWGAGSRPQTDFAPWGGAISFNTASTWNFNLSGPTAGANDFLSTAIHELAHVLGFGTASSYPDTGSWWERVSGGRFTGPAATAANGGHTVPVSAAGDHWAYGVRSVAAGQSQETAMDPDITVGTRKRFTQLDYAAMLDIGWSARPGDANLDDAVDLRDLAILARNYRSGNPQVGDWAQGDFDDDGRITAADLHIFSANYHARPWPAAPGGLLPAEFLLAIPEPGTSALLLVGAVLLRRRRCGVRGQSESP